MIFARLTVILIAGVSLAAGPTSENAVRRFTVADDIGLSYFGVPNSLEDTFLFSPGGQYVVVHTERGRVDLNRPESTLRIYETREIHQFLLHPDVTSEPLPVWEISRSSYRQGPIITHIRWLADSIGIAFLAKAETGNDQVLLADFQSKNLLELTPKDQHITAFDIRSPDNFIYCVLSPEVRKKLTAQSQAVSVVGTDIENLFPPEASSSGAKLYPFYDRSELWAVVNGRRFRVEDSASGRPFSLFFKGQQALAMSPDHQFAVTAMAVDVVPLQWEKLYPQPSQPTERKIIAGKQDLNAIDGFEYVSEYVSVDLSNGKVTRLSRGPLGGDAGWCSGPRAAWSDDGQLVVLSDAFLSSGLGPENHPTAPCVAVVENGTGRSACLEHVHDTGDLDLVDNFQFAYGSNQRVIVDHYDPVSGEHRAVNYVRSVNGSWTTDAVASQTITQTRPIDVSIRQSLNDPPVLVASDNKTKATRVIWDPNPQLKSIVLGDVSVLRWKDKAGREQIGGLYKPPDYVPGRRYPLVIQTHGFSENEFSASGAFPTATAAQEMAAVGIFVLQVRGSKGCAPDVTPKEAECNVENYEAAVQKLVSDGMVDQDRVGIIGFSWTCYHVLAALTTSSLHYKAASITDGLNAGYFQYIMDAGSGLNREYDSFIGAAPFGEGLQQWLKRSPGFNLDKIRTPLQVVGMGKLSALSQWEPYAALRILNKPVDLIILSEGQHLLTNPAERMVSQGGTVDWFRFWLKGEEDPDPAKSEQYVRWRELRKLESDTR